MKKFKAGDEFFCEKNGKTYTGEVLFNFDKTYLVMWHHVIGTFYLPAELVETYNKGVPNDNASGSPLRTLCGGLPASEQGDGEKQVQKA